MRIAITGADGFVGWHLRCALLAEGIHEVVPIGRSSFSDPSTLAELLFSCQAVVHLAGVNRGAHVEVEEGNRALAAALAAALPGSQVRQIVHGNSIHAGSDTPFGRSKAWAAEHLAAASDAAGAKFTDVILPNLFGQGGRPHYNSFVATFCAELAAGRTPVVDVNRDLDLLHAQDAADVLIAAVEGRTVDQVRPRGTPTSVNSVLALLLEMASYPDTGELPDLSDAFRVALFSTWQAACFPHRFPIPRVVHADQRGTLFETSRARNTDTLSFVSTTVPGAVRGQHYHRRKVERFAVVDGQAEIRLRRLVTGQEVTFAVAGDAPAVVDMPPLWAHSLFNVGSRPVTTVFWTNELLDPAAPDTFRSPVYPEPHPGEESAR